MKEKVSKLLNQAQELSNGQSNDENVMFVFGDDFSFMNAYANFDQIRKTIKMGNDYGKAYNISFVVSTPR